MEAQIGNFNVRSSVPVGYTPGEQTPTINNGMVTETVQSGPVIPTQAIIPANMQPAHPVTPAILPAAPVFPQVQPGQQPVIVQPTPQYQDVNSGITYNQPSMYTQAVNVNPAPVQAEPHTVNSPQYQHAVQQPIQQPVQQQVQQPVQQPLIQNQAPVAQPAQVEFTKSISDRLAQAGISTESLVAELAATNGKLTDGTRQQLSGKFGDFAEDIIESATLKFENQRLKRANSDDRNRTVQEIVLTAVGSPENKAILDAWAVKNLPTWELDSVNRLLREGSIADVQSMMSSLVDRYNSQAPAGSPEPTAYSGQGAPVQTNTPLSKSEFLHIQLHDPKYNVDPGYTKHIDARRELGLQHGI